jgi:uncharacterized membrane protein
MLGKSCSFPQFVLIPFTINLDSSELTQSESILDQGQLQTFIEKGFMLHQLLIFGVALLVLLGTGLPAYAQESTPEQPATETAAPPESLDTADISDTELDQFVSAVIEMETIRAEARESAVAAIATEGMTTERFSEILETQRSPETASSDDINSEEMAQFQRALTQIADIQDAARARMREAIEAEGLAVERFDQIVTIAQTDVSLQEEIQRRLDSQS